MSSNSMSDGSFKVRRVCIDDTIISMFMLDDRNDTPDKAVFTSVFSELCSTECGRAETVVNETKEYVATSLKPQMPSSSGPIIDLTIPTPPTKRNLAEAFDDEDVANLGFRMKIPKIEKE